MSNSMKDLVTKAQTDVETKLNESREAISEMSKEAGDTLNTLKDMPEGLDADLVEMVNNAEQSVRKEALADIENVENTIVKDAKTVAKEINKEVNTKISDNASAIGKLESITGKYGKDSISNAKSAIDENSRKGEELIKVIEEAVEKAENDVKNAKDSL